MNGNAGKETIEEMAKEVPCLEHANNSIRNAAARMADEGCDILFVIDADELVGNVSGYDIVVRGIAENRDLDETPIAEIMNKRVPHCHESDTAGTAARIMADGNHSRLAVVNDDDELTGIIDAAALAEISQDVPVESLLTDSEGEVDSSAREAERRADPAAGKSRKTGSYVMAQYSVRPKLRRS